MAFIIVENETATLRSFILPQQEARLLAKDNRSIDGSHSGDTMPQVPLKLVNVILALPSPSGMLTVDRIHSQSPWTNAEQEGVLSLLSGNTKERTWKQTHFRANRTLGFCIPLNCEVQHRLLMFVFQESENDERCTRVRARRLLRHIF